MHWRLIPDDKSRGGQVRMLFGSVADVEPVLAAANAEGYGVFAVINPGGNQDTEISGVRAYFIDDDTDSVDVGALALPLTIVVRGRAGIHAYWVLNEVGTTVGFTAQQKALAAALGTDAKISNLSRVMRVPGFDNCKNGGRVPVVLETSDGPRYDATEIYLAWPPPPEKTEITYASSIQEDGDLLPVEERKRRYRAYLAAAGPSISWQGGNNHALVMVRWGVSNYLLDEDDAWECVSEWNATFAEPWEDRVLISMIRRMLRQPRSGDRAYGEWYGTDEELEEWIEKQNEAAEDWNDEIARRAREILAKRK
jgi:DNA primase RepB-like protein